MEYNSKEIKEGIKLHVIKTDLFKTNLISIFITEKLSKQNVTVNALIPTVLRRGTKNMETQEQISKVFEDLYGAEFNCGIDKTGDNHVLKFYVESLSDKYINSNENVLEHSIDKILEIVFNPFTEMGEFKEQYVLEEKENIRELIESKIDSKDQYAMERCVEEVYKGQDYGLYKYGNTDDLIDINSNNLYSRYLELIKNAKIDIFISGDFDSSNVEEIINKNENINKLNGRNPNYVINNESSESKQNVEEKMVNEQLEVGQGKLVIGLDIVGNEAETRYAISLYNIILGGSPNSKMFQNIREKESLAYSIGSVYLKPKNNIFIKAGIEKDSFEKTVDLIKKQIEDMKNGDFSEEDLEKAKKFIMYGISAIIEEQETGITYYFGQELSGTNISPEKYKEQINSITVENIKSIAEKININTIYFLSNKD